MPESPPAGYGPRLSGPVGIPALSELRSGPRYSGDRVVEAAAPPGSGVLVLTDGAWTPLGSGTYRLGRLVMGVALRHLSHVPGAILERGLPRLPGGGHEGCGGAGSDRAHAAEPHAIPPAGIPCRKSASGTMGAP